MSDAEKAHDKSQAVREWFGYLTGVLLVFLAATMYGIGRAYRVGYLREFGLDLYQVPEDFYGYLYWGFVRGIRLSVAWLAASAGVLFAIPIGSWLITRLGARWPWIQSRIAWWEKIRAKVPVSGGLLLCFVYLVLLTHFAFTHSHANGSERGRRLLGGLASSYKADRTGDVDWIELHFGDGDSIRTVYGYRLLCTEQLCSIYDPSPEGGGLQVVQLEGLTDTRVFDKPSRRQALCISTPNGPISCAGDPTSKSE